jgi:Tol biopolymer transport system component
MRTRLYLLGIVILVAVFLSGLLAACIHVAESSSASPTGTIGFPSAEGLKTVYVLISPRTGVVTRLRVRQVSRDQVFLFWFDGMRIWTLDNGGVRLLSSDGATRRRVPVKASTPTRVIGGLSWSPDGRRFVYTDGGGLFVDSVSGSGTPRRLVVGDNLYQADWSPRGDQIVFVERQTSDARYGRIRVVSIDGRGLRTIVRGFDPAVSPDGKKLAFATRAGVFVMPLREGTETVVATDGAHPQWSPDGRYLAYTRDVSCVEVGCSGRVFVIPSSGGRSRPWGPKQFDIGPLFWSP